MPQVKHKFIGDRLDKQMPDILNNRMTPEEWNHFVREMNQAIADAQSYMRFSPWFICSLVCVAILVILLDVATSQGVFGNSQAGTLTLSTFVAIGILIICYLSMCRPTNYCEHEVELICKEYCDSQRDIYFFYRHHNNMAHISENRFYIEIFVGELPQQSTVKEETQNQVQREQDPEWVDDEIPVDPEPGDNLALMLGTCDERLTLTAPRAENTALTVRNQDIVYRPGPSTGANQHFASNVTRGGPRRRSNAALLTSTAETSTALVSTGDIVFTPPEDADVIPDGPTREIV